jgi:hypothetical protein
MNSFKNKTNKCLSGANAYSANNSIHEGLSSIPRQIATFNEFRIAMLSDIRTMDALKDWRTGNSNDLGTMLMEMWACVCDALAFYDEVIAHESYIRTARRRRSLRKLAGLLGYVPRPAVAALTHLAVIADDFDEIIIPERTAFRSSGFNGEAPQIFETESKFKICLSNNRWELIPTRSQILKLSDQNYLYLKSRTAMVNRGDIIVLATENEIFAKLLVNDALPYTDTYGDSYLKIEVKQIHQIQRKTGSVQAIKNAPEIRMMNSDKMVLGSQVLWARHLLRDKISIDYLFFTINKRKIALSEVGAIRLGDVALVADIEAGQELILDRFYSDISRDEIVILEDTKNNTFILTTVSGVESVLSEQKMFFTYNSYETIAAVAAQTAQTMGTSLQIMKDKYPFTYEANQGPTNIPINPQGQIYEEFEVQQQVTESEPQSYRLNFSGPKMVTKLTLDAALPEGLSINSLKLYYNLKQAGELINPRPAEQIADSVWQISDSPKTYRKSELPSQYLFKDVSNESFVGPGSIKKSENAMRIGPLDIENLELMAPVSAYGNILEISRGETVENEILGSGEASLKNQSFTLKKKPLTYLPAPAADNPQGILSTLRVWVNGILWKEAPHFQSVFGDETAQVYIVRQDDNGESIITFGDGHSGSRLPTGVDNVKASYRYGAGAAKPPAESIKQIVKPVKGITTVFNPMRAFGGRNAESKENIRFNSPKLSLLLDRAVSIIDIEAIAANFLDVRAVKAEWFWVENLQRPAVTIWYIGARGTKDLLYQKFKSYSDPALTIFVQQAKAIELDISIVIEVNGQYIDENVKKEVEESLLNKKTGILAPENIGIGIPLYRSHIIEQVMSVEGVMNVSQIGWNGDQRGDFATQSDPGTYYDVEGGKLRISTEKEI